MSFFFGGDHFGEAPEMPGRKRKDTNTTGLYEVLGVNKEASPDEIKRAYKKLAVKHHPDKGGDEAKFKEITEAADILLDEDKRRVYDVHGKEGVDAGMADGAGGDAHDLFSSLFGGGGGGGQRERRREIAPIQRKVEVTLEDLYNGTKTEVTVTRKRTCQKCNGTGANKPNAEASCDDCRGRGVKVVVRQVAPGFVQQFQSKCEKCEGSGTVIPKKFQCGECKGEKLSTDEKVLTVEVTKGMYHAEKIVFREEGHMVPDLSPGDVVVVLAMSEHEQFKRKESDLKYDMKVSLAEALDCERKLAITHLDKRVVVLARKPGHIITPGSVMVVHGEGMPKKENPTLKGDLYIEFTVIFPTTIPSQDTRAIVASLAPFSANLAAVPDMSNEEEHWETTMEEVSIDDFGRKSRRTREAYHDEEDDDDEEGRAGGGGVQCQQM